MIHDLAQAAPFGVPICVLVLVFIYSMVHVIRTFKYENQPIEGGKVFKVEGHVPSTLCALASLAGIIYLLVAKFG